MSNIRIRLVEKFIEHPFRLFAPVPGIVERGDLRLAAMALWRLEKQVVIAFGIERRVEINEVDSLVFA